MSSKVEDLIEVIMDQIPEDKLPNLFPALNLAITLATQRLRLLDSRLVIGDLDVPVYASIDYTASTIAFVDGKESADTITDSASQFVTEGFAANMPIETDCASNLGPFRISSVAAGTITLHAEYALVTQAAGSDYTITSIADYGYLPDDFGGLVERPYIDGYTWELYPLPSQAEKLIYSSAGQPKYYDIKGNQLHIIPATSSDVTIKGDYYKRPAALTKMTDYVPFYGEIDQAIQAYLISYLTGQSAPEGELYTMLDLIVLKRDKKAPAQMPEGIRW